MVAAILTTVVLLDLRSIGMTGKVADLLVSDVHITANETVPFDPESPFVTSGLRLGTLHHHARLRYRCIA